MKKHGARSQAKIRIPLEQRLVPKKLEHLPALSSRDIIPAKPNALPLTGRITKTLLSSPLIERSKKNLLLMKELQPIRPESRSSSSQGSRILKRLQSGRESQVLPQLVVLRANQDKRSYLRAPVVRESLVGEQAVQKFYQRYKQLDRRREQEAFLNEKHALTSIVALLQFHNFTPRKLTVVKLKGEDAILDLRKLGIGQGSMGPVVAEIMGFLDRFEQVDLSYNRIDALLGQALVERLGRVKRVDLSHNRIGKVGCDKFGQLFLQANTRIEQLNLEQNNLLDNAGAALIQHLHRYGNLRKLNLNKNFMGTRFAQRLKELLGGGDKHMNELYLSWNEFSSKAVKTVLEGVLEHSYLKVFDFSWNKIEDDGVDILAKIFTEAENLVHVDFSFCQIRLKSIPLLSKALHGNHTLYGVHFQGNSGFIDHKGFLIATEKQFSEYPLPIIRGVIRRIDGIKPFPSSNEYKGGNMRDVCWICHSWQERYYAIEFLPEMREMQQGRNGECYIHFRHENYNAVKMFLSDDGLRFELTRMCPIDSIQFFFTFSVMGERRRFICKDYQSLYQEQSLSYFVGKEQISEVVQCRNNQTCQYYNDPLDEAYAPNIEILPRSPDIGVKKGQKIILKKKRKVMKEEKVKVNLKDLDGEDDEFLKDRGDRDGDEVMPLQFRQIFPEKGIGTNIQDYIKRCIDFDIANSKIPKLIKDAVQLQKFKTMMVSYYRYFKDTFYYLAHNNPSVQNIFTISQLEFANFLEEQKYVTKRVTMAKIMLKLYACLSAGDQKQSDKKPENSKLISRPQFLQFLVRLAIEKWCFNPHKKKKPPINMDLFWQQEDMKMLKNRKQGKKQTKIDKGIYKKQTKPPPKKQQEKKEQQIQEDEEEDEADLQLKKFKISLPLPLIDGIQRTASTLIRYGDSYKSAIWRRRKYLKIDILIVIKAYEEFLNSLFDKYTESKFKTNKPKRLLNLLTLEQLRTMIIDTDIRKTKEAMKEVDQAFLDAKRLEIEDGNLPYGLSYDQFLQCLARIAENVWFNPPAAPTAEIWDSEVNRKNTPLFIRLESLIIALYWRTPDLHNRRMTKICQKGIFEVEIGLIMEKIEALTKLTGNFGLIRRNSIMGDNEISLKDITDELREKFDKMVVHREEEEEYEVEHEIFDHEL